MQCACWLCAGHVAAVWGPAAGSDWATAAGVNTIAPHISLPCPSPHPPRMSWYRHSLPPSPSSSNACRAAANSIQGTMPRSSAARAAAQQAVSAACLSRSHGVHKAGGMTFHCAGCHMAVAWLQHDPASCCCRSEALPALQDQLPGACHLTSCLQIDAVWRHQVPLMLVGDTKYH